MVNSIFPTTQLSRTFKLVDVDILAVENGLQSTWSVFCDENLLVPVLAPLELEALLLGQVLLDAVVGSLDEHVVKSSSL